MQMLDVFAKNLVSCSESEYVTRVGENEECLQNSGGETVAGSYIEYVNQPDVLSLSVL
jgi:hypothetical protein